MTDYLTLEECNEEVLRAFKAGRLIGREEGYSDGYKKGYQAGEYFGRPVSCFSDRGDIRGASVVGSYARGLKETC